MAALLSGTAQAAATFTAAGVTYVDLKGFAQDNGLTLTVSGAGIVLKGRGKTVTLYPYSKAAKLNAAGWTMAAPALLDRGTPSAPLADMQRAFGVNTMPVPSSTAPTAAAPGSAKTTAPAVTPAPTYTVIQVAEVATFDGLFDSSNALKIPQGFTPSVDGVFRTCRAMINADLKSPATAQYSSETVMIYPANHWAVLGTVDAQNGYGALVRGSFSCFMRWTGSEMQVYDVISTRK
ncbi:stalk domain-containing protein [Deinococcus kurensis]|uniref:stalk domain-containing protein n=1 Tax=Deinococcus kurensis TaxID=2662757 RepID=UPI0012D32713|nr:hypothetical protein [Deinococcus kurensis]